MIQLNQGGSSNYLRNGMLLAVALMLQCCNLISSKSFKSPSGYDFKRPMKIKLPDELNEISGLTWSAKDKSLLCEGDEHGFVYKIHPRNPDHIERWQFGKDGDYEDLALVEPYLYVLKSNGDIYRLRFLNADSLLVDHYNFPEKGNEFETLCYDADDHSLMMICKDCDADKKKYFSVYAFDTDSLQYRDFRYHIKTKQIEKELGEKGKRFKPSAAAYNPANNFLYILSGVNNALVRVDREGDIVEVTELDPAIFPQPEGIAFDPDGTMYISNEAGSKYEAADILIFPYQSSPAKK